MLTFAIGRTVRPRDAARAAGIWLGMAVVGGLVFESARPDSVAVVAALGTLAVISRRQWALAVPLGAAVLLDASLLPWAVAAVALTRDIGHPFPSPRLDSEPQRQLMRSRRRNEPASVIVVQATPPAGPAQVWPSLRATDGFDVVSGRDGIELRAVLEDHGLDRRAFEERIRGVLGASDQRLGWASFPADGVTLEVLVDAARARLATSQASAAVPVAEYEAVRRPAPSRATAIAES